MTPNSVDPYGNVKNAIVQKWGSIAKFLEDFSAQAAANFGSGWTWLTIKGGQLTIENSPNANNPINYGSKPLLTVDVWEHAYYIDYRNVRAQYLTNYQSIIDWKFVESNYNSVVEKSGHL
jgi:Fe-Mn family superoxide dismutase